MSARRPFHPAPLVPLRDPQPRPTVSERVRQAAAAVIIATLLAVTLMPLLNRLHP